MATDSIKKSREILLLKEQYDIPDDDPIFLFLQGYDNLIDKMLSTQERMSKTIGEATQLERQTHNMNHELLKNEGLLSQLSDKLAKQNSELPSFVMDELRGEISFIAEEIDKLEPQIKLISSLIINIRILHDKHSSTISTLAKNADTFTRAMEKVKTNQPSPKILYSILGVILLLQIVNLVV